MKKMLPIILFLIITNQIPIHSQSVIVNTKNGSVSGNKYQQVNEFLGIPYAMPPIDSLRWKAPRDAQNYDTVLVAKKFQSPCTQKRFEQGEPDSAGIVVGCEDCLYLNIWSPNINGKLPVLFYIHGGGNQQGSASSISLNTELYNGKLIAERLNIVVVTINYRVGPLGFLVHEALENENGGLKSGNYGILDQIKALEWVNKNIEYFGGDTSKIMIFGESAGAVNTGILLISPKAEGLFSRALMQSGIPLAKEYHERIQEGINFTNEMGNISSVPQEQLDYLRTLPDSILVSKLKSPFSSGLVSLSWGPVIDNNVIPDNPYTLLVSGEFNKVPILNGSNSDETSFSVPEAVTPLIYKLFLTQAVPAEFYDEALMLYPANSNQEARESYIQFTTDGQFTAGTRRVIKAIQKNSDVPVYNYFFNYSLKGIFEPFGAYHGLELFFVFQTLEESSYNIFGILPQSDRAVMEYIGNYWRNFADYGNPNSDNLPLWEPFTQENNNYLELNSNPSSKENLRKLRLDFWDKISSEITNVEDYQPVLSSFKLFQNYPNPFNPSTTIQYSIPPGAETSYLTSLRVYDILGNQVATLENEHKAAGIYEVNFDASRLASGVYFYKLQAGSFNQVRKMMLLH